MNQPYARVNLPYATLTLASVLMLYSTEVFGVKLNKNNAHAPLWRIVLILNSDWQQHVRSVRGVYELLYKYCLLVRGMVENYCPEVKLNPGLLFTEVRRAEVNSRPGLSFTEGTIIFYHFPNKKAVYICFIHPIHRFF